MIGAWCLHGTDARLEYRLLEGSCKRTDVVSFLRWQAAICDPEKPTVVVLDNAPFHKGGELLVLRREWESQGLILRFLPPYCPQLNLCEQPARCCLVSKKIEGVWRVVKGFLMPRRSYGSLADLRVAVLEAFKALNAVEV